MLRSRSKGLLCGLDEPLERRCGESACRFAPRSYACSALDCSFCSFSIKSISCALNKDCTVGHKLGLCCAWWIRFIINLSALVLCADASSSTRFICCQSIGISSSMVTLSSMCVQSANLIIKVGLTVRYSTDGPKDFLYAQ